MGRIKGGLQKRVEAGKMAAEEAEAVVRRIIPCPTLERLAPADAVIEAVQLGANLPMGPLTLIDLIGLDVHLAKTRYSSNGGLLGRKTGRGFFSYND